MSQRHWPPIPRPGTGSNPNARVDVESPKKLSAFLLEKLQWLETPVNFNAMVALTYLPR